MEFKRTLNNYVLIKLDLENTSIKLKSGFVLYVDNTFDPEKHATVTGIVWGVPSHLIYSGKPNVGMPWLTNMEVKLGDKVIIYYLSVINALKKEEQRYFFEGDDRYILIKYENLYAVYGDGFVKPVNGYVLIEPVEDPAVTQQRTRMKTIGLDAVIDNRSSKTHVVYGRVKYIGQTNREYADADATDRGCDVKVGDVIVMRKTTDIPLNYELHSKIEGGAKLLRIQRRNIMGII